MDRRGHSRSSGSRAEPPAREPVQSARASAGAPANDNAAPLTVRLLEAGKWALLLAMLAGLAAYLLR